MHFLPEHEVISSWAGTTPAAFKGCSDAVFMSSRDGLHWNRRFLEAFTRPRLWPKNWTDRNMIIAPGIVQTGPGAMSIYYVSHYGDPSVHLRRLALRLDGFVSVSADYQGGAFVTRPLVFSGASTGDIQLLINYATSAVGDIQVEVQDAVGAPVSGYTLAGCDEIVGAQIERAVTWDGGFDLNRLAGKPIRLRFVMSDADLYSLRFRAQEKRATSQTTTLVASEYRAVRSFHIADGPACMPAATRAPNGDVLVAFSTHRRIITNPPSSTRPTVPGSGL